MIKITCCSPIWDTYCQCSKDDTQSGKSPKQTGGIILKTDKYRCQSTGWQESLCPNVWKKAKNGGKNNKK